MSADAAPLVVALTGASGAPYGLRLIECLARADEPVDVLISDAARVVLKTEEGLSLPTGSAAAGRALVERLAVAPDRLRVFGSQQWSAPFASGSSAPRAMVICPCSSGTLSAVATGASNNLIERAADVCLKERRDLLVVPREMPYSQVHLENMLKLARMGVVIMPASPGFYHGPNRVSELVDFVVARILDHLRVPHALVPRWGASET